MRIKEIPAVLYQVFTTGRRQKLFINRTVKDRLFRFIFSKDPAALLQLYNALNGTDYEDADALEIVTLDNIVYMSMKNDLAFIVTGVLNLYEHQSLSEISNKLCYPSKSAIRATHIKPDKKAA